jgi:YidC/Oxa1 family membrane protein insertase
MTTSSLPLLSVLGPVEDVLLGSIEWIHETLGVSWAWAIVLLTVAVRVLLVPLTVKQQQSMRKLQALQPEIKKLQAKHKGDRQTLNQEMMALYRDNNANPAGSCLPLLVQIPIFLAMFFVLRDLDEEFDREDDRSFLGGFLPDISDFLHEIPTGSLVVLMLVYIGSQIGSTLLMPSSLDKIQRYLFLALPIVFAFVLINQDFPAGLMLYWITTNLWTVAQAAVIRWVFPNPHLTTSTSTPAKGGRGRGADGAAKRDGDGRRDADGGKDAKEAKGVSPAARKGRSARRPGQPAAADGKPMTMSQRRRAGAAQRAAEGGATPPGGEAGPSGDGRAGRRRRRGGDPARESAD